jgi:SAM-dependent methyltransferase
VPRWYRSHGYGVPVPDQPQIGDAFGELMRAALAEERGQGVRPTFGGQIPRPVIEIVERDDGLISGTPADRYLSRPADWPGFERRALDRLDGRVLDIGAGAGRVALALQDRGVPVVALDVSPGSIEVARTRGVRETACTTVDDHARGGDRYDAFALFGNNIGLLANPDRAPVFLAALAAMARPGARLIGQGTDPYGRDDEVHNAYHARNRAAGRMGGQLRLRVRYRELATDWFDYLLCSPDELASLVHGTPWRIADIDAADAPFYVATLRLA